MGQVQRGCELVCGHSLDVFAYLPPSSEFAVNVELVTSGDASQVQDAPGGMPLL